LGFLKFDENYLCYTIVLDEVMLDSVGDAPVTVVFGFARLLYSGADGD
jgi:hypothetical protein